MSKTESLIVISITALQRSLDLQLPHYSWWQPVLQNAQPESRSPPWLLWSSHTAHPNCQEIMLSLPQLCPEFDLFLPLLLLQLWSEPSFSSPAVFLHTVGRLILLDLKSDHITLLLNTLQELASWRRVDVRATPVAYKALNNLVSILSVLATPQPQCLLDTLQTHRCTWTPRASAAVFPAPALLFSQRATGWNSSLPSSNVKLSRPTLFNTAIYPAISLPPPCFIYFFRYHLSSSTLCNLLITCIVHWLLPPTGIKTLQGQKFSFIFFIDVSWAYKTNAWHTVHTQKIHFFNEWMHTWNQILNCSPERDLRSTEEKLKWPRYT